MSFKFVPKFMAVALLAAMPVIALAQDGRRVKKQVQPTYPDHARQMHVLGAVKIEVTIAPSGKVVKTEVLGGHPLLIASAEQAVKQWQYEPAAETTSTMVVVNFSE